MITERKKECRNAEVYTSSLNDIMFFLLLFFLIISTMVTPATIKVLLPKASASQDVTVNKPVNMIITADEKYFIEGKEIPFSDIETTLNTLKTTAGENEFVTIMLQADESLHLQKAVDIFDISYRLGMKTVLYARTK